MTDTCRRGALTGGTSKSHYPPSLRPAGCRGVPMVGAVAQMGERRVRNAKVRSSILLGSTNLPRAWHAALAFGLNYEIHNGGN